MGTHQPQANLRTKQQVIEFTSKSKKKKKRLSGFKKVCVSLTLVGGREKNKYSPILLLYFSLPIREAEYAEMVTQTRHLSNF